MGGNALLRRWVKHQLIYNDSTISKLDAIKLINELFAERDRYREALEGILNTVALDWYVDHYGKDESPTFVSSGIAAKIHNIELRDRISRAFSNARAALNDKSREEREVSKL